jgi:hypothetical protein
MENKSSIIPLFNLPSGHHHFPGYRGFLRSLTSSIIAIWSSFSATIRFSVPFSVQTLWFAWRHRQEKALLNQSSRLFFSRCEWYSVRYCTARRQQQHSRPLGIPSISVPWILGIISYYYQISHWVPLIWMISDRRIFSKSIRGLTRVTHHFILGELVYSDKILEHLTLVVD